MASFRDGLYSTWLSEELAHWRERRRVLSDAFCRPQTLLLLGGILLLCRGPAWMPSDTKLSPGENESSLARRGQQVPEEEEDIPFQSWAFRISLVVQWLRIRLPMQDTRVPSLLWEDSTCRPARRSIPARCNWRKSVCSNIELAQPKIINYFLKPAPSHSSQYVGGKGKRMPFSSVLFV